MPVLCERKKMTREELLSMRPYILAWRKKEEQCEIEELQNIHKLEELKHKEEDEVDFNEGHRAMEEDQEELSEVIEKLKECEEKLNHLQKEKHDIFTQIKSVLNKQCPPPKKMQP